MGDNKRQGKRTDLTSRHDVGKLSSEAFNESERTIERYIRLTYLIPELLDMVDKGQILVVAGVQLSYITDGLQRIIYRALVDNDISKLKENTAKKLRMLAEVNELTEESIYDMFTPKEKPVKNTHYPVKEFVKTIKKLLPEDVTAEDAKAIAELIDRYFNER